MAVAVPGASQIGPLASDGGNAFASTCGAGQPENSERRLRSRPPKTRPLEHLLAGRSHVLGAPPRCFTGGAERRGGLTGYQWLTEQHRKSPAVAANRSLQVVASKEQPAGSKGQYHKYPQAAWSRWRFSACRGDGERRVQISCQPADWAKWKEVLSSSGK